MKRIFKTFLATGVIALGMVSALQSQASVVIGGTRVVYNAKDRETTVKLSNEGKSPALAQIWIDKGDPSASPSGIEVPFTVTPPVARIDPGKAQTLRIIYTGEPLPQDKESVFWLNMLEVPPKPSADEADANKLQMAFRTRVKLFFRPAGLEGEALEAPAKIDWRLVQDGARPALEGRNPTPYHVSVSSVELSGNGKSAQFDDGGMIAPGETKAFPLSGDVPRGPEVKVNYKVINDYGGSISGEAALSAPASSSSSK